MNKKSLLLAAFAAVGLSTNAQQILKIGFESDEPKGVYTTKDSTQFAGFFADHINLQADDTWNEQGTDAHSGEYALEVDNTNTFKGNPWDRGFKIRNIQLEDNTSYRISYWVKADPQMARKATRLSRTRSRLVSSRWKRLRWLRLALNTTSTTQAA